MEGWLEYGVIVQVLRKVAGMVQVYEQMEICTEYVEGVLSTTKPIPEAGSSTERSHPPAANGPGPATPAASR
jgi:hypothetical protein